jgi:hypothetical protein
MRGASVVGASIWDSGNRWITILGTNYPVVRDCVGYRSLGQGFFKEDGTEVYNVLDRNLAVQACVAKPLPKQVLPFDKNDSSGFYPIAEPPRVPDARRMDPPGAGAAPPGDSSAVNADSNRVSSTAPFDLHLQTGSPAIGAGTNLAVPSHTFDGLPRPAVGEWTIGAY